MHSPWSALMEGKEDCAISSLQVHFLRDLWGENCHVVSQDYKGRERPKIFNEILISLELPRRFYWGVGSGVGSILLNSIWISGEGSSFPTRWWAIKSVIILFSGGFCQEHWDCGFLFSNWINTWFYRNKESRGRGKTMKTNSKLDLWGPGGGSRPESKGQGTYRFFT